MVEESEFHAMLHDEDNQDEGLTSYSMLCVIKTIESMILCFSQCKLNVHDTMCM